MATNAFELEKLSSSSLRKRARLSNDEGISEEFTDAFCEKKPLASQQQPKATMLRIPSPEVSDSDDTVDSVNGSTKKIFGTKPKQTQSDDVRSDYPSKEVTWDENHSSVGFRLSAYFECSPEDPEAKMMPSAADRNRLLPMKLYNGVVTAYLASKRDPLYHVVWEDGDEEDYDLTQYLEGTEAAAVSPSGYLFNLATADMDEVEFVPRDYMKTASSVASAVPAAAAAAKKKDDVIDQYLDMIYDMRGTMKPVEQLHLQTGEVLRIYPRGKDAAVFIGVSQSGISLCCSGTAPDCYGFRWRLYEGPPINFRNHWKYNWLPLESLKKMQLLRGRFIDYDMNEERTRLRQALGAPRRGGAFPVQYNVSSHRQPTPSAIGTLGAAAGDGVDDGGRAVRRAATAANESISHTLAPNRVAPLI